MLALTIKWTWLYIGLVVPLINEILKCYIFSNSDTHSDFILSEAL